MIGGRELMDGLKGGLEGEIRREEKICEMKGTKEKEEVLCDGFGGHAEPGVFGHPDAFVVFLPDLETLEPVSLRCVSHIVGGYTLDSWISVLLKMLGELVNM